MAERSARSTPPEAEGGLAFRDPAKRRGLHFDVLPIAKLEVISHQRKASDAHVKRVMDSVDRVGFLAPVVVVERDGGGGYLIIDGQHRFLAAKELGLRRIPAVIAPRDIARRMLTLNVEKEPNIRERSAVALSIYRELVDADPDMPEDDPEVADAVQQPHYVTLGLAYAESGRLAGSQFEPILRKCDGFMDVPLAESLPVREARAGRVVEAHRLVRAVSDKLKEIGAWHEFAGAQIISYANPLKRARKQHSFDQTFDKLIAKLDSLGDHPEKALRGGG
ncbi:MAG TPA: ParB/RepB/Spo0J family partition protein [Acidimicrobiia bacterium]|jgi:ParB family chromosome partitioning protein|nr:ParB/RepB/Spo0J family partition protein [Acidimicrobiia bacterium]